MKVLTNVSAFLCLIILYLQLCPFPFDLVRQEIEKYPNAKLLWMQEEHKNQGYWSYIKPHLETVTNNDRDIR